MGYITYQEPCISVSFYKHFVIQKTFRTEDLIQYLMVSCLKYQLWDLPGNLCYHDSTLVLEFPLNNMTQLNMVYLDGCTSRRKDRRPRHEGIKKHVRRKYRRLVGKKLKNKDVDWRRVIKHDSRKYRGKKQLLKRVTFTTYSFTLIVI